MAKKDFSLRWLPCLAAFAAFGAYGQQAQNAPAAPAADPGLPRITTTDLPDNPQSLEFKQAAKRLAGDDPVLNKAWSFFCTPTRYNDPAPEVEPMKVFDNLYEIPSSPVQQTTVWAITTSAGIILIDSGQVGRTEAILADMRKLGLDPANVKYILLGHGHGDHYASAAYFQEHYGTRVGTTAKDWDLIYPPDKPANPATATNPPPKRDLVFAEGPFTLGDTTIRIVEIPGHTPGSVAFIFKVKDHGRTHTAGLFGGTILDQPRISIPDLKLYLASISRYQDIARKEKVDVEIQNHALFDDTPGRLERLKTLKAGAPNPFVMSPDKYANLWNVVSGCIQSEIARRPPGAR